MSHNKINLLLGSNLFDRKSNLFTAQKYIELEIGSILQQSEIIETIPEGFESENRFLNQVIKIESALSPMQTLTKIKNIEKQMGRVYNESGQRYEDRLIDIDILNFNNLFYESKKLTIPHHQIISRKFVKKIMI